MPSQKYKHAERADSHDSIGTVDLAQQSPIGIGCPVCGLFDSRVVCSPGELAAHHRYLESFYRRRWRVQSEATAERLSFTQNYSTHIVECRGCGLVHRSPQPSPVAVFRSDRYSDTYLQAEYHNQRRWVRQKFTSVSRHLLRISQKKPPRVLEIGSFVGRFLAEGLVHGWDMFGVDPGQDVTAFCRKRGLPVFCGTVEEARLNPHSFDAVVIWNTFDQLSDPHPTLTTATNLLRNGGTLVIRVPNGACFRWAMGALRRLPPWFRRPLRSTLAWNNLLTFPYLYGYALDTLTDLVELHGFRRTDCVPDALVPVQANHLKFGAVVEERCCEWLSRVIRQAPGPDGRYCFAPWLDVYFERACGGQQNTRRAAGSDARLGLLPVYAPAALGQTHFNESELGSGGLIRMDVKMPCLSNLIPRLLSGGALRRADSRQEPIKKRRASLWTLDLIRMGDAGVRKG